MANRVHAMTESGLLAAVTVVMALIGVYVPLLGTVAILVWPLPILLLIVRHGVRWGIMAVLVAGILTALLAEPTISVRLALAFAPGGIALGIGFRRDWGPSRILTVSVFVSMAAKLAALALLFAVTGVEPFSVQFDMMENSFDDTLSIYRGLGMPEGQIAESREILTQNLALIRMLIPLIVVMMGIIDTMINFIVGGMVLRRLGHSVRTLPPFFMWRLSPVFVYIFGFSLVGAYWGATRGIDILYRGSLNLLMLSTFAGLLEGFAVYAHAARHFRWPKILAYAVIFFVMMNSFLVRILAMVGLFDMVFDYRERYWRE